MKKRKKIKRKGRMIRQTAASGLMAVVMLTGCTAQSGAAQFSALKPDAVQPEAVDSDAARYSAGQFSAAQFSTAQFSATQFNAAQLSAVKFAAMHPGAVEPGAARYGAAQSGGAQSSAAQNADGSVPKESREYPNGTRADYDSLLVLMTPGYENMVLEDFNRELLAWADEDYERAERIGGDVGYHDFAVPLTQEELFFVTVSANYSHMENAKSIQSHYTGREEEDPYVNQDLGYKDVVECGRGAYAGLWYQFSYHVNDRSRITVGVRDRCIDGMISEIQGFWNEAGIETLLTLGEDDMELVLQQIADANSTGQLTLHIEAVSFEKNDERLENWDEQEDWYERLDSGEADETGRENLTRDFPDAYDSLTAYRTDGYENMTVGAFNASLASDEGALQKAYEAYAEVVAGGISPSDENADFLNVTLNASLSELHGEKFDEPAFFPIYLSKKENPYVDPIEGDVLYKFCFFANVYLEYHIQDPEAVTVAERDRVLTAFRDELQSYVERLSREEIMETDMRTELERRAAELIRRYASYGMEISCEIDIEVL